MAFNVSDKHGNHIGITYMKYPIHRQARDKKLVLVALTENKLEKSEINTENRYRG